MESCARICRWAVVRLHEPDRAPTTHLVGYIVSHDRLMADTGEPYIGSSLIELDPERRVARNRRGKLIELVGDPLPPGTLPDDIRGMMRRAEREWRVAEGAVWNRVETSAASSLEGAGQDEV